MRVRAGLPLAGAVVLLLATGASSASAADLYLAPGGVDAGTCQSQAAPCSSFSYVQSQAGATPEPDTVHLAAGDYEPDGYLTTPNITWVGPQAGVPAQGRTGPEARIIAPSGGTGLVVQADGLAFDGLTITSSTNGDADLGFYNLNPSAVSNTIFKNVLTGLYAQAALTLSDSTFDTNGDAMYAAASTVVSNTRFSPPANSSGLVSGTYGPLTVTSSNFTRGVYGLLAYGGSSPVTLHGNSFSPSVQHALFNQGAPIDATNNWWGCNTGANTPGCATWEGSGSTTATPYLTLRGTATPDDVDQGTNVDLAATLAINSVGTNTGYAPVGTAFTFASDHGTVTPPTTGFTSGASAHSTLSGLNVAGTTTATVSTANATIQLPVTVHQPGHLTASPGTLDFGVRKVGTTSPAQTVTLTNDGDWPATIDDVSVSGAAGYSVTTDCDDAPVPVDGTCNIDVTSTPTSTGTQAATLEVSSDADPTVTSIGLTTDATDTALAITPAAKDFGPVPAGGASPTTTFTITNTGASSAPVRIANLSLQGIDAASFSAYLNACRTTLAPGESCTFSAAFRPTAVGAAEAQIAVTAADEPTHTVGLSGLGTGNILSVDPDPGAFGAVTAGGTSPNRTFTVTNDGPAATTISAITLTGSDAGEFTVYGGGCRTTLAPGAQCSFTAGFAPTTTGAKSAQIRLSGPGQPATLVGVSGTGAADPLSITPAVSNFGATTIYSSSTKRTFTIANSATASAPVAVTALSLTGPDAASFVLFGGGCRTTLAPGEACEFTVQFRPTTVGAKSAQVRITATGQPGHTVTLTGNGRGFA